MSTPQADREKLRSRPPWVIACIIGVPLLCLALSGRWGLTALREENRLAVQREQTAQLAREMENIVFKSLRRATRQLASVDEIVQAARGTAEPDDPRVLLVLETAKRTLGASLVYVLGGEGTVLACTPYDGGKTLTGKNYAFRPCFRQAMTRSDRIYPGLGETAKERGLYFSSPVYAETGGEPAGVLVVKASFGALDAMLSRQARPAALVSRDGIVVSTNTPDWMYRAVFPIEPSRRSTLLADRQFADKPLRPLPVTLDQKRVELGGVTYTPSQAPISIAGCQLVTLGKVNAFHPLTASQKRMLAYALGTALLLLATIAKLVANVVRRRRAEEALRQANDTLESRVAERTRALIRANVGLKQEVAEHRQTEQALRLTQFAVDRAGDIVFWVSPDARIEYANDAACRALGYSREELLARTVCDIDPDFPSERWPIHWDELRQCGSLSFESRHRRKDGRILSVEITANHVELDGRELSCSFVRDITERKRVEKALQEREAKYRQLIDSAHSIILRMDTQGVITFVNPFAESFFGFGREELLGKNVVGTIVPEEETSGCDLADMIQDIGRHPERYANDEYESMRRGGERVWIAWTNQPILDEEGNVVGLLCVGNDITERKLAERRRTEHATLLKSKNMELEAQRQQLKAQQTELLETNRALGKAKAVAEDASRSKSEFLANMSHEIRTPMTAILGFADVLNEEIGCCERCSAHMDCQHRRRGREAVTTIRRNSDHLLCIINDILDLSKIEAGKLEVECLRCSPIRLVEEIRSMMRVRADGKGLWFNVEHVGPIPETIETDPTRLRQILINLAGNAIKFTDVGGVRLVIRFLSGQDGDSAPPEAPKMVFDVLDTGIGMSPDQVERLFEPFQQGDTSTSRRFGGTGLGLTISKRLAEMLGGTITVDSQVGRGSAFTLTVATGNTDRVKMRDRPWGALAQPAEAPARDAPSDASPEALDCRILLAEDGVDNQRLISLLLTRAGADVEVAGNGQVAVDKAQAALDRGAPFDVILMDMQMPVLDGYRATRQLRQRGHVGPIIAVTAHAMASDRAKCLEAGCSGYVSKPINREALLATIAAALKPDAPVEVLPSDESAPLVSTLADDPDMVELVEEFVAVLPKRVQAIEGALAERDIQMLASLAHQLKGSAGSYGFAAVTEAAKALESTAKAERNLKRLQQHVRDLAALCGRCTSKPQPKTQS